MENFKIILEDRYFWQSVVNTLGISFLKLAFGFVLPIILAVMIYELRDSVFKRVIQTISYLPHFLSWIILGGMLITWFSSNGMINGFLNLLGFSANQNHMLDVGKYWWIAALSDVWKEAGWGTILYLAAMSKIDPTFYEAAKMDGATRLRQVWSSYVYRIGLMQGDFSYATAVGLGISIISVILLTITNIITKRLNDNKSVL